MNVLATGRSKRDNGQWWDQFTNGPHKAYIRREATGEETLAWARLYFQLLSCTKGYSNE